MSASPPRADLKRNCSMSPAGLAKVFAALAALVLAIGVGFAAVGAWLVLPFAGLEILALVAAYVTYARRFRAQQQVDKRFIQGKQT